MSRLALRLKPFRATASGLGQNVFGFMNIIVAVLGGSWVVISGVISRVTLIVTHIRRRVTPLISTHEPPSKADLLFQNLKDTRVRYLGLSWQYRQGLCFSDY